MNVDIENIGSIEHGIEGRDQYVLMRCDEDTCVDDMHNWLIAQYRRECSRPGGYFCHYVSVVPHAHVGKYIGIIYHRYDV